MIDENSSDSDPISALPLRSPPRPTHDPFWKRWLIRNPFFPFSAGCLIYGIYQLSLDPNFLGGEQPKLIFNFSALQLYEAMVAAVAILLARRKTWDDATFLVILESLFALVPFLLLTQAIYIGKGLTALLCALGMALVGLRWGALKKLMPDLNYSNRFCAAFSLILAANAALPFILIHFAAEHSAYWEGPSLIAWWIVLPLLQSLILWIQPSESTGNDSPVQHRAFPWICFHVWTIGSAVNLWAVGYVSNLPLKPILLAPFLWVIAWSLWRQYPMYFVQAPSWIQQGLLFLPFLATWAAVEKGNPGWFVALTCFNALAYGGLYLRSRNRLSLHLGWLSLCALTTAIPVAWAEFWLSDVHAAGRVILAAAIYLAFVAMFERHAAWPVGACFSIACLPWWVLQAYPLFLGLQGCLMFLIIYQLRWVNELPRITRYLPWLLGIAWVTQGFVWVYYHPFSFGLIETESALLLAVALLAWMIRGHWKPAVLPWAAAVGLVPNTLQQLVDMAWHSPIGLQAILGAFVLFGAGTLLAWNRHRWFQPPEEPTGPIPDPMGSTE